MNINDISRKGLTHKMLKLVVVHLFIIIIVVFLTMYYFLSSSFKALEESYVDEKVDLAIGAFNDQVKYLETLTFDWAIWDDSYEYIQGNDAGFERRNLSDAAIENLEVDLMAYLDENMSHLFIAFNQDYPINFSHFEDLIDRMDGVDHHLSGYVSINDFPYIFSLCRVKRTDGSGFNHGYLIMAKQIDESLVIELNNLFKIDMRLSSHEDSLNEVGYGRNDAAIRHSLPLKDAFGNVVTTLTIHITREMNSIVYTGFYNTLFWVIISLISFSVLLFQFWNREVLARVLSLKEEVANISEGNKAQLMVAKAQKNKDEIDDLRYEVMRMHNKIINQSDALVAINLTLESKIEARTSEINRINQKLIQSEKNYRTIVDQFPEMVFKLSQEGIFLACEGGLRDQLILPKDHLIGKHFKEVLPDDVSLRLEKSIRLALETKENVDFEYGISLGDETKEYLATLVPQENDEIFAFVSDLTETHRMLKEVEYLSFHDQLTGLYNRRYFETEYNRLNTKRNLPMSIITLDVNGLKMVNDAFGHLAGDQMLCDVSNAIKMTLRSEDIVARMGGDEFVILLPQTDLENAALMKMRIRENISDIIIHGMHASVSVGSCTEIKRILPLDAMLKVADDQMYTQKMQESQSIKHKAILDIQSALIESSIDVQNHIENVRNLARRLGKAMRFTDEEINQLDKAALYHDIGKMGVSDSTADAFLSEVADSYLRHVEIGYQLLKASVDFQDLADIVLGHHENWDGSGFPNALKGEDIPNFARVLRVVDAFDHRVHKGDHTTSEEIDAAVAYLWAGAGKEFDPEMVHAFIKVVTE